jgi:hypothetical protein
LGSSEDKAVVTIVVALPEEALNEDELKVVEESDADVLVLDESDLKPPFGMGFIPRTQ